MRCGRFSGGLGAPATAVLAICLTVPLLRSQSPTSPGVARAEQDLARARELAARGVLPPMKVRDAESALADAQDEDILDHMLYGKVWADLTESQGADMVEAARRRLERSQKLLDRNRNLIAEGVAAPRDLSPLEQEVDRRRLVVNLANDRARLLKQAAEMARAEAAAASIETSAASPDRAVIERYDGDGILTPRDITGITVAFERRFSKPLPVSARGETAIHRMLGFDHRGRIDVALNPDQPEGVWLRRYLESREIPYFAFRAAVAGKATAPHIHIGPGSTRLRATD